MSLLAFDILARLGAGSLLLGPLASPRKVGIGLYRFTAAMGAVLLLAGWGLGPDATDLAILAPAGGPEGTPASVVHVAGVGRILCVLGVILAAFAAVATRSLWSGGARKAIGVAGVLGVAGTACVAWGTAPAWPGAAAGAAASSAILLGAANMAMITGHAYLMVPSLRSMEPLRWMGRAFLAALLLRIATAAVGPVLAGVGSNRFLWTGLTDSAGLVGGRVLCGLVIPLAFAWMTLRTVRLEANQSATGILYVAEVFVLVGEGLSSHLIHTTRVPL